MADEADEIDAAAPSFSPMIFDLNHSDLLTLGVDGVRADRLFSSPDGPRKASQSRRTFLTASALQRRQILGRPR